MKNSLPEKIETLEGVYDHDVFRNDESGWTVGMLEARGRIKGITLVGSFIAQPGETLELSGTWVMDPKFGQQFRVQTCKAQLPSSVEGLRKYLASGMIKGIGPAYAERLIARFGIDVPHVIEQQPYRLREVEGIGSERQKRIVSGWNAQKEIKTLMIFLQGHGVSASLALKVYKAYGDKAVDKIRENPYRLASDVSGVGFKTADQIARKIGVALDAPERIDSGIEYVLKESAESGGHTALLRGRLSGLVQELLEVATPLIEARITVLTASNGKLVLRHAGEGELIFLRRFYDAEVKIARRFLTLKNTRATQQRPIQWEKFFEWFQDQKKIEFSEDQKRAVRLGYEEKLAVITGGPGTGKSTLIQAITLLSEKVGLAVALAAPTGRAAKRLAELSRKEAKTIHRLLEFDPKLRRFKRQTGNPLEADVLILDEVSMIDVILFEKLLEALGDGTRLILVGDQDQLPPVGPGNVLRDVIASQVLPVVRLSRIYRQSDVSRITEVAHGMKEGDSRPLFENREGGDCFFFEKEDAEAAAALVVDLVCKRIPEKFGLNAKRDIQVLVPMNRGVVGVQNLNQLLQKRLNPAMDAGQFLEKGYRRFAVGDRVIQTRNNYDLEIFNGDIGSVKRIDKEEVSLVVAFDDREVVLDSVDIDDLELAYAISIHKSQGSEFPAVVIPVHMQHAILLQRNLLYTGITRGKKMVVVVGSRKAVGLAVQRTEGMSRTTYLKECLLENMAATSRTAPEGDSVVAPVRESIDTLAFGRSPLPGSNAP